MFANVRVFVANVCESMPYLRMKLATSAVVDFGISATKAADCTASNRSGREIHCQGAGEGRHRVEGSQGGLFFTDIEWRGHTKKIPIRMNEVFYRIVEH